jgi:acetyltransferase-like isoleucine patch superfamily enzyme
MRKDELSFREWFYLYRSYWWNRLKYARLRRNLSGSVSFGEGCDIWADNFRYRGWGNVKVGKGTVVEVGTYPTIFDTEKGSEIILGRRVFLRGKYCSNVFTTFVNARIEIGDDCGFNGAIISAKQEVRLGKKVLLAWGVSILDSDMHDLSNTRKERTRPVEVGDYVLMGNYVSVLPGVKIGSHCVIGANSVVTRDIPGHSIAAGAPAKVIGEVDDRDLAK